VLFENFQIAGGQGVELSSERHNWDLHNFADFSGYSFDARNRELHLQWTVSKSEVNPWGDPTNKARSCSLRFYGVKSLQVGPREPSIPFTEDLTLEEVVPVLPGRSSETEYALATPEEEFALRFQFHSGAWIEVVAERACLLPNHKE
jgi:hypothetical protein